MNMTALMRTSVVSRYLCLLAATLAFICGAIPPLDSAVRNITSPTPCYGLASESADASCVLTAKNEQTNTAALVRVPCGLPRMANVAADAPGTILRICSGVGIPTGTPPITAHHLRV